MGEPWGLAWPWLSLDQAGLLAGREQGVAAGPCAQARKYFGMQLSPAGCVHPHGNPTLLLLP